MKKLTTIVLIGMLTSLMAHSIKKHGLMCVPMKIYEYNGTYKIVPEKERSKNAVILNIDDKNRKIIIDGETFTYAKKSGNLDIYTNKSDGTADSIYISTTEALKIKKNDYVKFAFKTAKLKNVFFQYYCVR